MTVDGMTTPQTFTERLYDKLYEQYDVMSDKSVLFACKRKELEKEAADKPDPGKRMAIHTEYYLKLTAAYDKAVCGGEKELRSYLELVLELLLKKGKQQIFLPRDKTGLSVFLDRWNGYWHCFFADGDDKDPVSIDMKDLTPAKISKSISEIRPRLDTTGNEYTAETLKVMQKELTDKCVQRAVESYIGEKRNTSLNTIDRDLINACEEDDYFNELFSSKKKDDHQEDEETLKEMLFDFIEKGMDKETPGSEECRNIFIPLLTDSTTAVSLCLIGRNYYPDEEGSEDFPCALAIMELNDTNALRSGRASVSYEAGRDHDPDIALFKSNYEIAGEDKTRRRRVCDDYFSIHYMEYVNAVARAKYLLRDINIKGMSRIPQGYKKSRLYSELSIKE